MLSNLKLDDEAKLLLRLTVAGLILFHGVNKLMNLDGTMSWMQPMLQSHGLPGFLAYFVLAGEFLAPLLIVAGFFSRIGGLLIVGNMLVAICLVHLGQFFTLGGEGGWALELQAFYLMGGLLVAMFGPGRYAINQM